MDRRPPYRPRIIPANKSVISRRHARPNARLLTRVKGRTYPLELPEAGAFNGCVTACPGRDDYFCVYRGTEYTFSACRLDAGLRVVPESVRDLPLQHCTDPRLVWTDDGRLVLIYSSTQGVKTAHEYICAAVLLDLNQSPELLAVEAFRISPPLTSRQKNWAPFRHQNQIYLVANICPHIVYELDLAGRRAEQRFETPWRPQWIYPDALRGNTNAVALDNGDYLSTFHTGVRHDLITYYDNGCYVFEGQPPFRVLRSASRTYLRAEDAVTPYLRNHGRIRVHFPLGAIKERERVLISYGENDSAVKILETTADQLLATTTEVQRHAH